MVKNVEPDSAAERGGLKPGDKILVINGENVEGADYTTIVERLKQSMVDQRDIELLVMNIVEYNLFKKSSILTRSETEPSVASSGQSRRSAFGVVDRGRDR